MALPLNEGPGICRGTHRLVIKPVLAAISLGSSPDVINAGLKAIHHLNRNGDVEDFIAVAFPLMGINRGSMDAGHELEAIGSREALTRLIEIDLVKAMVRRGLIELPEIDLVQGEIGDVGAAYVRNRQIEKHTPGWVRRTNARSERRSRERGKKIEVRPYDASPTLSLSFGDALLHIEERQAEFTGAPIVVSTYGFSAGMNAGVLPVRVFKVKSKHAA